MQPQSYWRGYFEMNNIPSASECFCWHDGEEDRTRTDNININKLFYSELKWNNWTECDIVGRVFGTNYSKYQLEFHSFGLCGWTKCFNKLFPLLSERKSINSNKVWELNEKFNLISILIFSPICLSPQNGIIQSEIELYWIDEWETSWVQSGGHLIQSDSPQCGRGNGKRWIFQLFQKMLSCRGKSW